MLSYVVIKMISMIGLRNWILAGGGYAIFCRIKFGISTDTITYFCSDHRYMHEETE